MPRTVLHASLSSKLLHYLNTLLKDPKYFWTTASLGILGDAILTQLILRFIPYTEIDWETYMVQTKVFIEGQRNYSLIEGPTGPLVYPAGHVRIHRALYGITNSGKDILLAQHLYAALYVATLTLCCAIYKTAGGVPNWVLLLLPLSKRLHSIFILRLFNDCWAAFFVYGAILLYQMGLDDTATFLFSAALSVKMSIALYLPGLLVILFKRKGLLGTARLMLTLVTTQAMLALPFLQEDAWAYLHSAFDFGRVFLYKWTVNWRFLDERTFLDPRWAAALLVGHVLTLIAFGLFRWCRSDGGVWKVLDRGLRRPRLPAGISPVSPDYVATVLFTSNLIGIIFARSLHYQFYSWYAQQIPFLAWRTPYPIPIKLAFMLGIEYAWNAFPSTTLSSSVLLICNVALLIGVWFGYPEGKLKPRKKKAY